MASLNTYAQSLRSDKPATKAYEEGVPFFVPQLSKVKTSVMCQGKTQKLLFKYETGGAFTSPLSPKVLPYRKQGNHSLYTEENLLKRQKLMEDPDVLQAIERFWADIWTIDIGAEQYVAFLNKLFERVTMIIYDHVKLQWFTAFAELDKIRSFDDPTPPDEDPSTQNLSSNEKADALAPRGPTKTRLEQVLEDKRTRTDGDMRSDSSKTRLPHLTLPETSLQQVLLPIPSIYLNPDLTGVHDAERAARRRLRQKAKLVMRLRRITY
ncbi:hypothetical protein JG688_00013425 [Phytophthora aleatoria]|uniref:Uncharacterized protein n=1 Tax=Phytophthora aleatoria TaxID=2496075 RepID=A0A8J5IXE3_9STRA|nr:hypothetical protein JG688_00013425 [Phytophthora aleatoria]